MERQKLNNDQKLELYNACVTSILLYGVEAQKYTQTQLQRLETFRMRHIRHITKTPSHLTHESNFDLRTRTKTPSITTLIIVKRLKFLRNTINFPHDHAAVIYSLFGTTPWDPQVPTCDNSQRLQQIHDDIIELNKTLNDDEQIPIDRNNIFDSLCKLKHITHKQITKIHSATSTAERIWKPKFGPSNQPIHHCACGKSFDTHSKLMTHQYSAHGTVNSSNHENKDMSIMQE